MKNRIFAMLLALIMVFSILPMAAFAAQAGECNRSPDGYHSWVESSNNSRKCEYCNTSCRNHTYNKNNNPTGQCTKCGYQCQHSYTQNGRTCNTCGVKKCSNHSYTNGVCTGCHVSCSHKTSGNKSTFQNGVCSVCKYECPHEEYDTQNKCKVCRMNKPACQHEYSSADGKCSKCGETCKHNYNKQNPNGKCTICNFTCAHTKGYDYWNKCNDCGMPKCNAHEYENGVCKNCRYVCSHAQTQVIPRVDPTCSEPGSQNGIRCKICDKVTQQPETIPPTEHQYNVFVGYKDGSVPTCSTPGTEIYQCATCERTDERNVSAAHKNKILVKQEATCAQEGHIVYTCELCGHDSHETFEKLPHTEEILPVQAATCTETGLKAGKKCSVCKEILVEQEVVDKLGHDWKTVAAKAATCTVNGNNEYKECNRCHATLNKEVIPAAHDFSQNPNKCSVCQARNPGCQHRNATITVTKQPTCQATGTQTFKCPDCGDTFVETLPRLNYHNYVNGTCTWCRAESCNHSYTTERVEPTCTEPGYTKSVCTICGKTTNERALAALNHNYDNKVVDGFCTRCGCPNPNAQKPENNKKTGELTLDLQNIFALG